MLKNKAYWQVYNQKRKAYLTLKKRESRAKLKAQSTTTPKKVVDLQAIVDLARVVDNNRSPVVDGLVVDCQKVVDNKPKRVVDQVVDHPILTQLIRQYQTRTNYSCPPTCLYSYCNNCWYFHQDELVDYKEVGM